MTTTTTRRAAAFTLAADALLACGRRPTVVDMRPHAGASPSPGTRLEPPVGDPAYLFTHGLPYPHNGGAGLVACARTGGDRDGAQCTPGCRPGVAGLAVPDLDADEVDVTLAMAAPCRGPEWFFPPRPRAGQDRCEGRRSR